MKKQLFLIPLFISAVTYAHAAVYKLTLADPVMVDGKELKPGDYKIEVNNATAVLRSGKDSTEATVKTETNQSKYGTTAVRCSQEGGHCLLQEIHLGGTKTKIVFESPKSANGGM